MVLYAPLRNARRSRGGLPRGGRGRARPSRRTAGARPGPACGGGRDGAGRDGGGGDRLLRPERLVGVLERAHAVGDHPGDTVRLAVLWLAVGVAVTAAWTAAVTGRRRRAGDAPAPLTTACAVGPAALATARGTTPSPGGRRTWGRRATAPSPARGSSCRTPAPGRSWPSRWPAAPRTGRRWRSSTAGRRRVWGRLIVPDYDDLARDEYDVRTTTTCIAGTGGDPPPVREPRTVFDP